MTSVTISSRPTISITLSQKVITNKISIQGTQGIAGDGLTEIEADAKYIKQTDYIDGGTFN